MGRYMIPCCCVCGKSPGKWNCPCPSLTFRFTCQIGGQDYEVSIITKRQHQQDRLAGGGNVLSGGQRSLGNIRRWSCKELPYVPFVVLGRSSASRRGAVEAAGAGVMGVEFGLVQTLCYAGNI